MRSLTFGAYLTSQWLPAKKLHLATSTYRGYERNVQLHGDSTYDELGADFFERRTNTEARQRQLVRQLEALGHKVTLEPAA